MPTVNFTRTKEKQAGREFDVRLNSNHITRWRVCWCWPCKNQVWGMFGARCDECEDAGCNPNEDCKKGTKP